MTFSLGTVVVPISLVSNHIWSVTPLLRRTPLFEVGALTHACTCAVRSQVTHPLLKSNGRGERPLFSSTPVAIRGPGASPPAVVQFLFAPEAYLIQVAPFELLPSSQVRASA